MTCLNLALYIVFFCVWWGFTFVNIHSFLGTAVKPLYEGRLSHKDFVYSGKYICKDIPIETLNKTHTGVIGRTLILRHI